MKQQKVLILSIAILGGIFLSLSYVNPYTNEITLANLILQLSGSRDTLVLGSSPQELLAVAMRMMPIYLFEVYAGIDLYRHFCTASVYVFSRFSNRVKWYLKQSVQLLLKTIGFQGLLLLTVFLVSKIRMPIYVDVGGILLLIYHLVIQTLWTYFSTLLINILALFLGSNISFMTVMGIQGIGIVGLGLHRYSQEILKYNPLSYLILGWHYSLVESVDKHLTSPFEFLCLETRIPVLMCICIAVVIVGAVVIDRYDMLVSDAEIGVI